MPRLHNKVQQCITIKTRRKSENKRIKLKWQEIEILEKLKQRELVNKESFEVHLGDSSTLLDRRKKRHIHQVLYAVYVSGSHCCWLNANQADELC